jgi:hypothetical protein
MFLIGFVLLILWIVLPIEYLLKFTSDDSFFYLKTAQNLANGLGSTFDGINPTNGYHPLWTLILWILFKVAKLFGVLSEEILLRLVFILTTILNFITLHLLSKLINNADSFGINFIRVSLLLIPFCLFYLIGLEPQIFLLLLSLLIFLFLDLLYGNWSRKKYFLISFIISLLFLARIDLFWYVLLSIIIYLFVNRIDLLKKFLSFLIIPATTIVIYLLLNKLLFDDFFPISSKYKLSFDITDNLKFFPTPLKNPIDIMVLVLIFFSGIYFYISNKKSQLSNFLAVVFFTYIGSLVFLVVNYLINHNGVREWYYMYSLFPALILLGASLERFNSQKLIFTLLVLLNFIYFLIFRANYYNHDSAYYYSKKLKEITSDNDIIYQVDYSGIVSFFSSRKIINGDGLINSKEYYDMIKVGNLKEYLNKVKPTHLSFYSFENPIEGDFIIYEFNLFKNYVIIEKADNILITSPYIHGGIFRKKFGKFYLVKIDEWNLQSYK